MTSSYTNNGQTVSPTTSYPGVSINRSTITADLNGQASIATTASNVNGFTIRAQTSDPGAGSGLATGTVLFVYA